MAHTAEIKRVQSLLRHAQQLSGASNQTDERIKSLSSRLEALQQLAGEHAAPSENESGSAEAEVSAEVSEETNEVNKEANDEVAAAEEQPAPDPQDE
jgi:vacuolar-type H+-ATPase subunit I/STV1